MNYPSWALFQTQSRRRRLFCKITWPTQICSFFYLHLMPSVQSVAMLDVSSILYIQWWAQWKIWLQHWRWQKQQSGPFLLRWVPPEIRRCSSGKQIWTFLVNCWISYGADSSHDQQKWYCYDANRLTFPLRRHHFALCVLFLREWLMKTQMTNRKIHTA